MWEDNVYKDSWDCREEGEDAYRRHPYYGVRDDNPYKEYGATYNERSHHEDWLDGVRGAERRARERREEEEARERAEERRRHEAYDERVREEQMRDEEEYYNQIQQEQ